jgi:hypothetical protein
MKTKLLLLLALIVFTPTKSLAADIWSKQDKTLQATYLTLKFIDWRQTRTIAKNPDDYYEMNPILGKHPSTTEVDIFFASTAILHSIVTHYLPSKYRPWWQGITITIKIVWTVCTITVDRTVWRV